MKVNRRGNELCIVSLADDQYAQHMSVTFVSVLMNLSLDVGVRFYVLSTGMSESNREKIVKSVEPFEAEVCFIQADGSAYESFDAMANGNRETYLRMAIADALPSSVERVICLDSDLIVTGDLMDLWGTDLNGRTVAAVTDQWAAVQCEALGIPRGVYFNAGVLLIDLKRWREQEVSARAIAFIGANREKLQYHDQDGLNAVLHDDWLPLPPTWNAHTVIIKEWSSSSPPAIVHYTGVCKAWHFDSIHPFKNEYYKYLRFTEWRDYRPEVNLKRSIKRATRPMMPVLERVLPSSAVTVLHKYKQRYLNS